MMKMMRKIIACLLSALLIAPYAFCAEVGRVTYVDGRVDILKSGSDMAVPVRDGETIFVGDSLRTKSNSKAEIRFADNSTVRLAQNSRVEVKEYLLDEKNRRKTATIKLDRGKARTIIAKMADAADFNILTPNAEGKVRGSDIFTFYQAGSSGILVAEGKMELKNVAHPEESLLVPSGNVAFVNLEESPKGPRPYMDLERKMHEQDTFVPPSVAKKGEEAAVKGVFVKISGAVKITPKGAAEPRDANMNDIIGEDDVIETGANGLVEIKFDNGCGLNLKPDTVIKITRLVIDPKTGEYQNLFESSKGKIKARIENLKGKSRFEIKTPTAICGARGTFMYIEITPGMVRAFFEGGNGYIQNLISGAQTEIGMGNSSSSDSQGNNSSPTPTSNEDRESWTQGWDSGEGTSGYSSGDTEANENLDTGGGDTGTGTGTEGGDEAGDNANPDVYIPPENTLPPPPPPPAPVWPRAFGYYSAASGFVYDVGTMSRGFYSDQDVCEGPAQFAVMGNYTDPGANKLWSWDKFSAATSGGSSFTGWFAGTKQGNDLRGLFYGFYVKPDGSLGYLKSTDITGAFNPNGWFYTTSADPKPTMTPTLICQTNLSPANLNSAIQSTGTYNGDVAGDGFTGTQHGESFRVGEYTGDIFREALGGTYENIPEGEWRAVVYDSGDDGEEKHYRITKITGDGSWKDGTFKGMISGNDIGYSGNGNGWIGLDWEGAVLGVYNEAGEQKWEAVGLGYAPIADMAFGGETTHEDGVTYALFGGTQSLWTGSPDILFMGDYSAKDAPSQELWSFHTLGTTPNGTAAIYGMAGGTKVGDVLKGLMYAIYIRPNPDYNPDAPGGNLPYLTGYLESTDIAGKVYPDLGVNGLFETEEGAITACQMGQTAVLPADLLEYMRPGNDVLNDHAGPIYRDEFDGKIGGDIASTSLKGESIGIDHSPSDQMWSIWRMKAGSNYGDAAAPEGPWHAVIGGSDEEYGDKGYYLFHINGPAWSGGEFTGNVTGRDLWYSSSSFGISTLGSTTGKTMGIYDEIGWQATSLGITEEQSLAFGGELDARGDDIGTLRGLFGGTQSLWTGSPDALFMGDYSAAEAPLQELWKTHTLGKTDDGAAIYGMAGGTKVGDVLKGLMHALCIRPDPDNEGRYLAGYLKSTNMTGVVYPGLGEDGMFEADGTINFHSIGQTTVAPEDLYDGSPYINVSNITPGLIDSATFSGSITDGTVINIEDQNWWDIWRTDLEGAYTSPAPGDWEAVCGGFSRNEPDHDTYWDGYYIIHMAGPAWSDGGFSGTVLGKALNFDRSGVMHWDDIETMEGNTIGIYGEGSWQAVSVGVTDAQPLLFGGILEGNGGATGNFCRYVYNPDPELSAFDSDIGSHLTGLIGGSSGLWGDPTALILGEYANPNGCGLWTVDMRGATKDGAAFRGFTGGSVVDNLINGIARAFYVRDVGGDGVYETGYLASSDIAGIMYPGISMFEAEGGFIAYKMGETDVVTPDNFYKGLAVIETNSFDGKIGGDITGTFKGEVDWITGQKWSLVKIGSGGQYAEVPSDAWQAVMGASSHDTNGDDYLVCHMTGDAWSDGRSEGTFTGRRLSYHYGEADPFEYSELNSIDGDTLGTYNTADSTWQSFALGTSTDEQLKFGGNFDVSFDDTTFKGLFGGTESLLDEGPHDVVLMGEFDNYGNYDYCGHLTGKTDDGGTLLGLLGGIKVSDISKKIFSALYIGPNPAYVPGLEDPENTEYIAGYLQSAGLNGHFYPDLGLFEDDGAIEYFEKQPTIYTPGDLHETSDAIQHDDIESVLMSGGQFSGDFAAHSMKIKDQNWALDWMNGGGAYQSLPSDGWTSVVGWSSRDETNDITVGYCLEKFTGPAWQNNELSGTGTGRSICYNPFRPLSEFSDNTLGTLQMDMLGVYDGESSWHALGIGSHEEAPLQFGANFNGGFGGYPINIEEYGGWETNNSERYYWDSESQSFYTSNYTNSGEYATVPIQYNGGSFNLEFDMKAGPRDTGDVCFGLFGPDKEGHARPIERVFILMGGYNHEIFLEAADQTGAQINTPYYENIFQDNEWYHFVMKYDASKRQITVTATHNGDDVLSFTSDVPGGFSSDLTNFGVSMNGTWASYGRWETAYIDNIYTDLIPGDLMLDMENTSFSGILGGIDSPWSESVPMTIMGEFRGAGERKIWATPEALTGATADGGRFLGLLGGVKLNDDFLKGIFYAFYIRPVLVPDEENPGEFITQYVTGYLKSADIEGSFYPGIGMFDAEGSITAHEMSQTQFSTDELNDTIIHQNDFGGKVGGDMWGTLRGEAANITGQAWSIARMSSGGRYMTLPTGSWQAVIGGSRHAQNDTDYWISRMTGGAWEGGGFRATFTGNSLNYNFGATDPFENSAYSSMDGDCVGTYDETNSTWQSIALGASTEERLTFVGQSPIGGSASSQFGYYDRELGKETFPSGELHYVFGATGSLWDDEARMTVIGEFSNPDGYKFWDNEQPLSGYTSDGARFYTGNHGFLCGITGSDVKDSSRALFYTFYIRPVLVPDPEYPEQFITQYLAGYLKSTDLSGEFYSSIDMFMVDGSLTHKDFNTTAILPENLAANITKTDSNVRSLVAGSNFSGTGAMDSYYIEGQGWGLFAGSSGGTYNALPANGNMRIGGYSENMYEEINAYFIGEGSDSNWQGDENSGTTSGRMSGTTITNDSLQAFSGESIGTYEAGNWQALNIGEWIAMPLKLVSAISDESVSLAGFLGSTTSAWAGSPAAFTFIGNCSLPDDGKYHMWGGDLRSYNYHALNYTTYDGGAYRGGIGGLFKGNSMEGGFIAIYVDNEGNAGTMYNLPGAAGAMYPEIATFEIDGTLQVSQKAYLGTSISPEDYLKNAGDEGYFNELNLEGRGLEPLYDGAISGSIARQDSTVFNILGQPWGIWLATVTGDFEGLSQDPASWRLGMGGKTYFTDSETVASYWAGTMDVSQAPDGRLTGTYEGLIFSRADEEGLVKIQTVSGNAKGYVEVEEGTGTWQAGAAGEWVEVTDLLNENAMFGPSGLNELNNFVNVPVTEVYSNILTGAGSIAGGIALTNLNSDFLNFAFLSWENYEWLANYNGQAGGVAIAGQAGGTYTVPDPTGNGTFGGAGAGIDGDILNTVTVAGDYGPDGTLSNVSADVTLYEKQAI